jgi:phosphoglycolate phosphatase
MVNRFVLFDIDGTLIDPGGAGRRSLSKAFYQLFSVADAFANITTAGKTDIEIIKEGLSFHELPSGDGILTSIVSQYVRNLRIEINNTRRRIMPGVVELLDALNTIHGYWLGLLTGNIEQGARIKLGAFNLNGYFPVGAFGDDSEDRNRLLPIAIGRLRKAENIPISYSDCIVIGDTPKDVQCSKPFGATSIVVSTGTYSYEALLETGADYVLRDLSYAMDLVEIFPVR